MPTNPPPSPTPPAVPDPVVLRPDDLFAWSDAVAAGWDALGLADGPLTDSGALGVWWALVEVCGQDAAARPACVAAADLVVARLVVAPDPAAWDAVDVAARDAGYRMVRRLLSLGDADVPLQLPDWAAGLREE